MHTSARTLICTNTPNCTWYLFGYYNCTFFLYLHCMVTDLNLRHRLLPHCDVDSSAAASHWCTGSLCVPAVFQIDWISCEWFQARPKFCTLALMTIVAGHNLKSFQARQTIEPAKCTCITNIGSICYQPNWNESCQSLLRFARCESFRAKI